MTKAHIWPNLAPLGEAPLSPSAGASRPSAPPSQVLPCQVLLPYPLPLPPLPSATQVGPREQSLPLPPFEPDFCMPRPWQPSGLASASGTCCSSWRIALGLLEPALPLIRGELVSPGGGRLSAQSRRRLGPHGAATGERGWCRYSDEKVRGGEEK